MMLQEMKKLQTILSVIILSSLSLNAQQTWYKGNTHMHTDFSDGDSPIKQVVDWYHDHGYNFLSITDHNKTIIPLNHLSRAGLRDDFIMIIGNEITSSVHFTALGVEENFSVKTIVKDYDEGRLKGYDLPGPDSSKIGHSQILINGMLDQGALVFINHPNFSLGISAEEMLELKGVTAIELANAHPSVYNYGNDRHIPVEDKWDHLLTNGMKVFAVGSDDEHHIQKWGPDAANPGRSWIMVEADELKHENILEAIGRGDFYTSTGVELSKFKADNNNILLEIDKKKTLKNLRKGLGVGRIAENGEPGFIIELIGKNGNIIESAKGEKALFYFDGIDKYLRVRASFCRLVDGKYEYFYAWSQPVFE